jgi:hypothetical protein
MRAPSRRNRPGPGRCHPSGRPPSSCCELLQATAFGKGRRRWRARRVSPLAGPGPAPPYLQRVFLGGGLPLMLAASSWAVGPPVGRKIRTFRRVISISMTTLESRSGRRGTIATSAQPAAIPLRPAFDCAHTPRLRKTPARSESNGGRELRGCRAQGSRDQHAPAGSARGGLGDRRWLCHVARAHSDARKLANERVASPLQAKAFKKSSWHRQRPPAAPPCGRFAWAIPVCGRGAPPYSRGASASAP